MAMYVKVLPFKVRTANETGPRITVWDYYRSAVILIDHPNVGGGFTVDYWGLFPGSDDQPDFRYSLASKNIVASGHTLLRVGTDFPTGTGVTQDSVPYYSYVTVTASGTNAYKIDASFI